jgi:hypothetical protein
MIALHEGDVSYLANSRRGAQFYPDCVQIEVTGDGDVELPQGVGFPGAYSYSDPGVVHNVISPLLSSPPSPFRNWGIDVDTLNRSTAQPQPPNPSPQLQQPLPPPV